MSTKSISRQEFLKSAAMGAAGIVASAGIVSTAIADEAPAPAEGVAADSAAAEASPAPAANPDWLGEAPVIADDQIVEEYDADILVIGGGHSGICCARKAAELGKSVIVMEKMTEDVYSPIGCDMAAVNADYYLEQGGEPLDTIEILNEWMRRTYSRSNPTLIKQFVERSGECANWIRELVPQEMLDEFSDYQSFPNGRVTTTITHNGKTSFPGTISYRDFNNTLGGGENMPALKPVWDYSIKKAQEDGAVWLWGTAGRVLVQDDEGNVIGGIGENESGYVKVNAKAVVLAAGDFGGNGEMVYALMDEVRNLCEFQGIDTTDKSVLNGMSQDGSGIKMGLWAGGVMEPGPRAAMNFGVGSSGGASTGIVGNYPVFGPDGKRFYNEALIEFGGDGVTSRTMPGGRYCSITDGKVLENMKYQSYEHCMSSTTCEREWSLVEEDIANYKTGPEGFQVHGFTGYGMGTSTVYAAETLEELADIFGYEGEAKQGLLDEIAHYNEMCAAGKDTDWGRDPMLMLPIDTPPFFGNFAVQGEEGRVAGGMVQMSGLMTDVHQQVVKKGNKQLIGGLYATGNCCGQRYGVQYHTCMTGNTLGIANTLGMVLGEHLASIL